MTDRRLRLLFMPDELRKLGRCPECGWHPPTQGHDPDCTREEADGESDR